METLTVITSGLSWFCLAGGSLVVISTGVALLRLPSYYSRVHGAGLSDGFGAGLMLCGLALQIPALYQQPGDLLLAVKLVLILAFLVLTGPTAAHALAKAAYLHGLEPEPEKNPPPRGRPPASSNRGERSSPS